MKDMDLEALFSRAEAASEGGITWTEFCRDEGLTPTQMRTALYNGSQATGSPIPVWKPRRGASTDQKITVQKKGIVILSKCRLPADWEAGTKLDVSTGEDSVTISRAID